MRFSELGRRQIINLHDGSRMGVLGDSDLVFDPEHGTIEEIQVGGARGLFRAPTAMTIPWSAVRRVGPEVIIVDGQPVLARR